MNNIPKSIREMYHDQGFVIVTDEMNAHLYSMDDSIRKKRKAIVPDILENRCGSKREKFSSSGQETPARRKSDHSRVSTGSTSAKDIPIIIEYVNWHMKRISSVVVGRDDVIRQMIFAILTGEHLLLLSRTGMGKSFLANHIFNTFHGARVFSSQASKDQTPDNYFGPYNIEEFKKGKIRHNIKGSIIEANLVFLDEFFDASDVVLRSLLSVLNERKFINGSEVIDSAVHSAIATANYMRMNEVTEAVLDRFTYKAIMPEKSDVYTQLLIDDTYSATRGKPLEPEKKIYFNQIQYLYDIIANNNDSVKVNVPDYIYFMKNVIVNKFVDEMRKSDKDYFISPRKQAKIADFLRASALLDNRFEATMDDLKELHLALCTLNSYVTVKSVHKLESDIYLDAYQQTMVHYNATGASEQVEFLLGVRKLFQEIRHDPDKREVLLQKKGIMDSFMGLLYKLFPRSKDEEEKPAIETLKKSIVQLDPALEEVRELKEGILKDYRDVY